MIDFIKIVLIASCSSLIWADIVITEFFITPAEGVQIPQYIELYNTSNTETINLEGWSINTTVIASSISEGDTVLQSSLQTEFNPSEDYIDSNNISNHKILYRKKKGES